MREEALGTPFGLEHCRGWAREERSNLCGYSLLPGATTSRDHRCLNLSSNKAYSKRMLALCSGNQRRHVGRTRPVKQTLLPSAVYRVHVPFIMLFLASL